MIQKNERETKERFSEKKERKKRTSKTRESKCQAKRKNGESSKVHSAKKKESEKISLPLMRPSLACLAASAARTVSRRAQRGIYAGKDVRSGNKVSEDGGNR